MSSVLEPPRRPNTALSLRSRQGCDVTRLLSLHSLLQTRRAPCSPSTLPWQGTACYISIVFTWAKSGARPCFVGRLQSALICNYRQSVTRLEFLGTEKCPPSASPSASPTDILVFTHLLCRTHRAIVNRSRHRVFLRVPSEKELRRFESTLSDLFYFKSRDCDYGSRNTY